MMAKYRFEQIALNSKEKKKPTEEDRFTYIGLEHLDTGSLNVPRFGSDVAPIGEKLIMRKGDVLFGKRRAYQKKVAVAPFDGIFSAHGMVLRPKEDVVDKNFFPLFISSDYFLDAAIKISVGSLSPTINWRDLKDLEFEMPDLHTQKKLAEVLWAINNAIESYKKLISATDELVKSQFIEMFIDKGYPINKLDEVCTVITDGTHKTPAYQEHGITFISAKNIVDGRIDFSDVKYIAQTEYQEIQKRCRTECGDILLTKSGTLGSVALVDTDQPLGLFESLAVLKYDREVLNGVFLKEQLRSIPVQLRLLAGVKGVAVKHLHLNVISEIEIVVPPMETQCDFAKVVHQSDKSKFELEQALSELTATYKRIISEQLG